MFATLYSLSTPLAALIKLAEDFTPRFEVIGPLVVLDVSGLSRLFGTPREIGEHLRSASAGPVRIAIAATQTASALLALGRPGLSVIAAGDERAALASLPVNVLGEWARIATGITDPPAHRAATRPPRTATERDASEVLPPNIGEMEDVLPYFQSSLGRTSDAAAAPHRGASASTTLPALPPPPAPPALSRERAPTSGGWSHPRDAHVAAQTRRPSAKAASTQARAAARDIADRLLTLRRWGITTLGQLVALPAGDVYERLGPGGVVWQRVARGEDLSPLVPWVAEEPYEAALDLEWPIEGLEPLSFVLSRVLEPLAERLERADRGAAILHTHLRLVDKTVHARMLQLPVAMRDPKTLRTLVLMDLESHPPAAAVDRVCVLAEPTPARITQWALFERAQPSAEEVSTLLARLSALMGASHVGSPQLVNSWRPGAFEMTPFAVAPSPGGSPPHEAVVASAPASPTDAPPVPAMRSALRRFRLPVPARVQVQDGRPVRILTDRRGVSGGPIVQAAGPWRTSGEWWNDASGRTWDRDEWDVALADGTVYRLCVERDVGQWFLEGIVD
jgi:protein ImuB